MNHRAREGASIALAQWQVKYEAVQAQNAELAGKIGKILDANRVLEAANAKLEEERAAIGVQLAATNAELAQLQAQEPSYPELESHPLVINLRLQLAAHDKRFSLAIDDIRKANEEIANYKTEIKGLEQAYQGALQMYANEHRLTTYADIKIAKLAKQNKTLKTVTTVEGVVIVVLGVLNMVK